jgi:hypothetical protein
MKFDSVIPVFFGGVAAGSILYFFVKGHGDELFKSFATHKKHHSHEKGGRHHHEGEGGEGGGHEHYHRHGHGGYLGTPGWYTVEGHHHCDEGAPGCICTDPSKCEMRGGGHGHHGREGHHHIHSGNPIHHHQRFSGEFGFGEEFDPSEFDFERMFGSSTMSEISQDNMSI